MTGTETPAVRRWWLVALAAAVMGVAGTYQFVWSSISEVVGPRLAVAGPALGTVYTLFIATQTLSQFPAGRIRDRYGPRLPLLASGLLLGLGYVATAVADGVGLLYAGYALGGVGAGTAYTVAINTPVKWFSDRKGLATGVVGMAYGGVSVLLIPPVRGRLDSAFVVTLVGLGVAACAVCFVAAVVLRDPGASADGTPGSGSSNDGRDGEAGDTAGRPDVRDRSTAYSWREAARTWQFWLLYAVFVLVNGVGLMVIGKAVSFAAGLGLSSAVATGAASVLALADGAGVMVGGGASDRFGRERTAAASLFAGGVALAGATAVGASGWGLGFVVLLGATSFFRSPVFAIFPTIVGDYYGEARSSENYAALYSAKVWGGLVGGTLTSALVAAVGWTPSFLLGAVALCLSGAALFALRPVDGRPDPEPGRAVPTPGDSGE